MCGVGGQVRKQLQTEVLELEGVELRRREDAERREDSYTQEQVRRCECEEGKERWRLE